MDTPDTRLGIELVPLVLRPDRWIERRVEQIRFLDERSIERRVSVDFNTPAKLKEDAFLAPLALLRKVPLTGFDLRDETGSSLPLLTRRENAHVAWSILVAMGELVVGHRLSDETVATLKIVAEEREPEAAGALNRLERTNEGALLLSDLSFEQLAYDFVLNFLLLTTIPSGVSNRRVFKFAYVEAPLEERLLSVAQSLALSSIGVRLNVAGIEFAQSYHLEVTAPDGLEISSAWLGAEHEHGTSEDVRFRRETSTGHKRVHLYLSDLPLPVSGEAWIWLRIPRRGLIRQAGLSAVGTVVVMLTFLYFLANLTTSRADAIAPLLLVIPGSISLVIATPGEHAMRSAMLERLRFLLFGLALVPYIGAVLLVVTPSGYARRLTWFILTAVAAVLAGPVAGAWAISREERGA